MRRLHSADFQAYLVGGGVRDLLVGGHPKDFDVATDASPEQVKSLFRGSRIVGRRFRIVHVRYGREIIEVTTFRGHHDDSENAHGKHESHKHESGMLLRDNVYGTMEDDALRRDFTVNALYYCSRDFCLYDYTDGLTDLRSGILRLIGDPETRYREDPVRMLRAARFAAKLGFTLAPETAAPIAELSGMIDAISPHRLFDETLKFFQNGYAEKSLHALRYHNLLESLLAQTHQALSQKNDRHPYNQLVLLALRNTDARIDEGKSITPAFLFAALLWPPLQSNFANFTKQGMAPFSILGAF